MVVQHRHQRHLPVHYERRTSVRNFLQLDLNSSALSFSQIGAAGAFGLYAGICLVSKAMACDESLSDASLIRSSVSSSSSSATWSRPGSVWKVRRPLCFRIRK